MNIKYMEYNYITTSLDVYVTGCNAPHCKGCHNPELWDFTAGYIYDDVLHVVMSKKIKCLTGVIDRIMVYGGELFDHPENDVVYFLRQLFKFNLPLWVFTRYSLEDIPRGALPYICYLKTGSYIEDLPPVVSYGITLASSNQMITKLWVN